MSTASTVACTLCRWQAVNIMAVVLAGGNCTTDRQSNLKVLFEQLLRRRLL